MPLKYTYRQQRYMIRGITLIESLVALFIISIGLLGVAGLQATSIAAGHTSAKHSHAVFYSEQIADRIRANRLAVLTYDSNTSGAGVAGCGDLALTPTQPCTAAAMALGDVFEWHQALNATFLNMGTPNTFGLIEVTAGTPNTVVITITWTERGTGITNYITQIQV